MKLKMSQNIAVRTADLPAAVRFYSEIIGFPVLSQNAEQTDLRAGPFNLFIIEDAAFLGPVMELYVDDLEQAKEMLLEHGCEVIRWQGKGKDCYVRDPFGVVFNLWELPKSG